MFKEKAMSLVICLLLGFGCTGPYPDRHTNYSYRDIKGNEFKRIHVTRGAVRTVCVQPDPSQPEMALVVKPLEEKLMARGYKVVATPDEAVHTMRLHLNAFGTEPELKPKSDIGLDMPGMMSATGTTVGGAVSGSALHAATTTGGAVGGVSGLVLGTLLSAGSKPQKGPMFYAEADVRISDLASGEQHSARGKTWRLLKDYNDPEVRQKVQQMAADDLANRIAALMP